MPGKRKITIAMLTKLGAPKLAELLLAGAVGNKQLKQSIELAISAKQGPEILGASVRKRLTSYANPRSMPSYERGREIIAELDGLRTIIAETIGAENPVLRSSFSGSSSNFTLQSWNLSMTAVAASAISLPGPATISVPWQNEQASIQMRWL